MSTPGAKVVGETRPAREFDLAWLGGHLEVWEAKPEEGVHMPKKTGLLPEEFKARFEGLALSRGVHLPAHQLELGAL